MVEDPKTLLGGDGQSRGILQLGMLVSLAFVWPPVETEPFQPPTSLHVIQHKVFLGSFNTSWFRLKMNCCHFETLQASFFLEYHQFPLAPFQRS
jgi:hypothetical protein